MDKINTLAYWQGLPWNDIKLKANKHLPKFIFIVLIILLTQTFAELTWNLFTPSQNTSSSQSMNNSNSRFEPSLPTPKLSDVSTYHLFGDAAKTPTTVQEKVIDAPETRLRLDLKGVFASSNKDEAIAIISSAKDKDKTYHIGDKVMGGALLHAVYADRVILKRSGKLETLRLPKPKMDEKAISNAAPNVTRSKPMMGIGRASTKRVTPSKNQSQRLRTMRDTLVKDPSKIWKEVRINPVMKNGKVQGYTLVPDWINKL